MKPFYYGTPDDIYDKLSKSTCFTVVDFKKAIWKEALCNENYLTSFNMPFGRHRFTNLSFGIKYKVLSSKQKFDEIHNDLPLIMSTADDMIIWGRKIITKNMRLP